MSPVEAPVGRERDVADEQRLHRELGVDRSLAAFSQQRCDQGPVRDWEDRDFVLEAREELADYLAYLTWELQRVAETGGSGERFQAVATALRIGSEAYTALRYADSL